MITENYLLFATAISTAGIALVIEPTSKLLAAAIRSFIHTITKGKTKL